MSAIVSATLTTVAKAINSIRNGFAYTRDSSLADIASLTRVEPLTIVSRDVLNADITSDVMNVLLNIFSGYYLQAISILTGVRDSEVIKVLDRVNPDRDLTGWLMTTESAQRQVLFQESALFALPGRSDLGKGGKLFTEAKDNVELVNEVSNLAVGKMLNVEIVVSPDGAEKVVTRKIPVNVRLAVKPVSSVSMKSIMVTNEKDTSLTERYHEWRAGSISFWRDLVLCQDLIDEYRKALHNDPTGAAAEIARRKAMNKKVGALSQNPSLAVASSIFVMSATVAKEVEQRLGGRLSKSSIRSKLFQESTGMIIAVIDEEYERVTFYIRGIEQSTDVSFSQVSKAAGKDSGKGPDVASIMNSLKQGMAPSF